MFQRRYAPLGFVAWLVAKRKLRGFVRRLGLALMAAGGAVGAALLARRLMRRGDVAAPDAAPRTTIRLAYEGDEWLIRRDGDAEPLETHRTKADAEKAARTRAQDEGAELVVYSRGGEIQRRHSYAE